MKATSNAQRIDTTFLRVEPNPTQRQVVDLESIKKSRKGRKVDNWLMAMTLVVVVLAGALAAYVLNLTISTLVSGQAWTPGGP